MEELPQRALILQGGGALGAYEAGAFKALYEKLIKEDRESKNAERPLFDIVAGSSIGAVNACFLVSYVLNNKQSNPEKSIADCWKDSDQALVNFWIGLANHTLLDNAPIRFVWDWIWNSAKAYRDGWVQYWKNLVEIFPGSISFRKEWPFREWYYSWPDKWGPLATGEGARRYYSYWNSSFTGIEGILTGGIPQPDYKFLNGFAPGFYRFDNTPLINTLKRMWYLNGQPISTKKGEPRLLLVSVDVQDCSSAATFDSYEKKRDGSTIRHHFTEYGSENEEPKVIEYEGVATDHLLASMSTNQRYEFPSMRTADGRQTRYFWDGAYLSNTPLREVIQHHRDFWLKTEGEKKVPDLEVYIINLYPATEATVPQDADSIQDREIDIKFHDRTKYDLKVAGMVTDYIDLVEKLKELAESKGLSEQVKSILDGEVGKSVKRSGDKRRYRSLIEGRFAIPRTVHVERQDDSNAIYGKAFDFSEHTVKNLIDLGYQDGLKAYDKSAE